MSDFQPLWQKLFCEDGAMACCTCLNILYVIVNTRKNIQLFLSSHRLYCICCIFLAFECLRECFSLGKCNTANPSLKSERSELSLLEFIRQNRFKSTPNQKSKAQRMYEMVILDTGFGEFEFSRTFWRFWNFPHFLTFEEFQPEFFGPFWPFGNLNFPALFYI